MSSDVIPGIKYRIRTFICARACEGSRELAQASDVAALCCDIWRDLDADIESFLVIALNARNRVTGYKVVSQGSQTQCLLHPREVFRAAIALGAATIVVAHNHPSGDPSPSSDDIDLTRRLRDAGAILGIPVLDHLVICASGSFRSVETP